MVFVDCRTGSLHRFDSRHPCQCRFCQRLLVLVVFYRIRVDYDHRCLQPQQHLVLPACFGHCPKLYGNVLKRWQNAYFAVCNRHGRL